MSARHPKLLGFYTIASVTLTVERTTGGGGPVTVPLDDGDYFASDEGVSDLGDMLYELEDSIRTAHASLDDFRASLTSDNLVSFSNVGAGTVITITWGANTALRDWLGYTAATTVIAFGVPEVATAVPAVSYWSPFGAQLDEPVNEVIKSSSKALGGQIYTVKIAEHNYINFGLRFPGWWRNASDLRYISLQQLWRDHLLPGKRARYYLDSTATGPYDQLTNPNGYHVVQLAEDETAWNVRSIRTSNRIRYEGSWRFAIYVA